MRLITSIALLLLVIDLTAQSLYTCPGDTLVVNGTKFTEPGQYNVLYTGSVGQDSVVPIDYRHHPSYEVWSVVEVCLGDSVPELGVVYKDTTVVMQYMTIHGCDSVLTLEIDVQEVNGLSINGDLHLCEGETSMLSTGFYDSYRWSTGQTGRTLSVNEPGRYQVVVKNAAGCVDSTQVEVTQSSLEHIVSVVDVSCKGGADGVISIEGQAGAFPPFSSTLSGQPMSDDVTDLSAGIYSLSTSDNRGCVWEEAVVVTEPLEDLSIQVDISPSDYYLGDSIEIVVSASIELDLLDVTLPSGEILSDTPVAETRADDGDIIIRAQDINGCQVTAVQPLQPLWYSGLQYPTAFSPNGDSNNDYFLLAADSRLDQVSSISIYDRWGSMVYHHGATTDISSIRWDGHYLGQVVQSGGYHIVIQYTYNSQPQIIQDMIYIF